MFFGVFFSPHSESDGEFRFFESRVTLETFLQECAGKVTVIVGQAGSGKTLLMSHLGQQWACGLVSRHSCTSDGCVVKCPVYSTGFSLECLTLYLSEKRDSHRR